MIYKRLSAPLTAHLELTTQCNEKCRHCYNFWREENSLNIHMRRDLLLRIMDELAESKVFHVVLTGGEPLLNYDMLLLAVKAAQERKISIGLNSNLILMTAEKASELKSSGVNSVLTSLMSYDPATHDYLSSTKNQHPKILAGIKVAQESGIGISLNMVISKTNLHHIYDTAKLAVEYGIKSFTATRAIPNVCGDSFEFRMEKDEVRVIIDSLMKIHNDFGVQIGSLIPYPLCFLGDIEKYLPLSGRSCSAGTTACAISADGKVRSCTHLETDYGSIVDVGLGAVWKAMDDWRDGSHIPDGCKSCEFLQNCGGGCHAEAMACKTSNKADSIADDPDKIKPFKRQISVDEIDFIKQQTFRVGKHCRFRAEENCGIVNFGGIQATILNKHLFSFIYDMFRQDDFMDVYKTSVKFNQAPDEVAKIFLHLHEKGVLQKI